MTAGQSSLEMSSKLRTTSDFLALENAYIAARNSSFSVPVYCVDISDVGA